MRFLNTEEGSNRVGRVMDVTRAQACAGVRAREGMGGVVAFFKNFRSLTFNNMHKNIM